MSKTTHRLLSMCIDTLTFHDGALIIGRFGTDLNMKGHGTMVSLISDSSRQEQLKINRMRWAKVLTDGDLAKLPYRIETSGTGQIIMTPPATGGHSNAQGEVAFRIRQILGGRTLPECPLSTTDGVKVVESLPRIPACDQRGLFDFASD